MYSVKNNKERRTHQSMAEESEARVSSWRAEIDRVTDEALSCTDATEEISKRSRIVKLWAAVVSKTNDAADKEQLALAEKQLYYAHLALLLTDDVTPAQRPVLENFVRLYEDNVRAQHPAQSRAQLPGENAALRPRLRCKGGSNRRPRSRLAKIPENTPLPRG